MATPCTKRRRDKSVGGEENGFMGLSHMPEGNLNKPARNHPQRKQFASGQKRGCSSIRYRSQPGHCAIGNDHANRSEEHTSELQSLMRISYAVFCLKKKKTTKQNKKTKIH